MLISFVIRVATGALRRGELAGEVENVHTGARHEFRDAEELQAWCALQAADVPTPRSADDSLRAPSSRPGDQT